MYLIKLLANKCLLLESGCSVFFRGIGKVKVHFTIQRLHEIIENEVEVQLYHFKTQALDGAGGQRQTPRPIFLRGRNSDPLGWSSSSVWTGMETLGSHRCSNPALTIIFCRGGGRWNYCLHIQGRRISNRNIYAVEDQSLPPEYKSGTFPLQPFCYQSMKTDTNVCDMSKTTTLR